ncbi:MAG: carboxylesterase/lipase family protein [Dehalococcoidia bacterium]
MTTVTEPIVETTHGKLQGTTDQGVLVFRGVQYGASTAGSRRFLPPLPAEPWAGVRDATEFGPICPQQGAVADQALTDVNTIGPLPKVSIGEDCLVLNVWTPAVADGGKRPVMVWLHGRGYAAGAGSETWYNGADLVKRGDVVVITINHRLNVFGYLHLADIGGEAFAGSGVAGMLDVVLALEYVRDNAEQFGGDPGNVTVFGESGGGSKVSTLLALPSAEGLFHRAIIQSGPGIRGVEAKAATEFAEQVIEHFGIGAKELHKLQEMPHEELTAGISKMGGNGMGMGGAMRVAPVVDGSYYPRHPFHPDAAPTAKHVPVMIGSNKDEAALFLAADPRRRRLEDGELPDRLRPLLGDRMEEILAVYRRTRPTDTPWELLLGIASERTRLASIMLAERKAAAGGAPAYMYLFTWEGNFKGNLLKSAHAMEIPFVFGHPDISPMTGDTPERHELADLMSDAWISFARNGDPSHAGLPDWPAYDAAQRATMLFNVPSRVENDPRREERLAWEGVAVDRMRGFLRPRRRDGEQRS